MFFSKKNFKANNIYFFFVINIFFEYSFSIFFIFLTLQDNFGSRLGLEQQEATLTTIQLRKGLKWYFKCGWIVCLFIIRGWWIHAAALPRDDEGDDKGMMSWSNGCSSNVFFSWTLFVFLLAASPFVFPLFTPSRRSTGEVYIRLYIDTTLLKGGKPSFVPNIHEMHHKYHKLLLCRIFQA